MSPHSYFKFYQLHKLVMSSIWLLAVHSPSAAAVAFFLALVLWLLHLTQYYKSVQDLLAAGRNLQVTGTEKCVKESSMLFWHLTYCLIGKYVGFILIVSKSFWVLGGLFVGVFLFFCLVVWLVCFFFFPLLLPIRCSWCGVCDSSSRKIHINVISNIW